MMYINVPIRMHKYSIILEKVHITYINQNNISDTTNNHHNNNHNNNNSNQYISQNLPLQSTGNTGEYSNTCTSRQ